MEGQKASAGQPCRWETAISLHNLDLSLHFFLTYTPHPPPFPPFPPHLAAMAPARFTGPRAVAVPALSATSMIGKKARKPRAPKEKPPGMRNANWVAEKAHLERDNLQRRTREKAQRERKLAHLAEAEAQAVSED